MRFRSFLAAMVAVAVLSGGCSWSLLQPVPDWRQHLHWVALLVTGALVVVAAWVAHRRTSVPGVRILGVGCAVVLWGLGLVRGLITLLPMGDSSYMHERQNVYHVEWHPSCGMFSPDSCGGCRWEHHRVWLGMFLVREEPPARSCGCG